MSNIDSLTKMFTELSQENKSYALGIVKALAHAQITLSKSETQLQNSIITEGKTIEIDRS